MAEKWQIDKLSFGSLNAEDDAELLSYFHRTTAYYGVLEPGIRFILGPKGSGKSALFRYVPKKAVFEGLSDALIVSFPFPDLSFYKDHLQQILSVEPKLELTWQFLMAIATAASLGSLSTHTLSGRLMEFVHRWTSNRPGLLRQLLASIPSLEAFSVKLAAPAGLAQPLRLTEITDAFALIHEILATEGREAWLFMDKLDETADQFDKPQVVLQALMRVQSGLTKYDTVRLKMFLRDDIYDELPYVNKDHFSNQILRLSWEPQDMAIILAARTLASFGELDEMPKVDKAMSVLSKVFDPVPGAELVAWMTSELSDARGFASPRDAINFAEQAVQRQKVFDNRGEQKPEKALVSHAAIEHAMIEASQSKLHDFLYGAFPEVKQRVEALRGLKKPVFSSAEFEQLTGATDKADFYVVAQKLQRTGAVTPYANASITTASHFQVGRIYRRALGIPTD